MDQLHKTQERTERNKAGAICRLSLLSILGSSTSIVVHHLLNQKYDPAQARRRSDRRLDYSWAQFVVYDGGVWGRYCKVYLLRMFEGLKGGLDPERWDVNIFPRVLLETHHSIENVSDREQG